MYEDMKRYIDKSALVAEIDRQKIGYNVDGKHSIEYDTTRKILNIIDTIKVKDLQEEPVSKEIGDYDHKAVMESLLPKLKEEPVSEELEHVSGMYGANAIPPGRYYDKNGIPVGIGSELQDAFMAGANWQKSQGVTEEAVIGITPKEYFISISQSTVDALDLCAGDKVIVQLRKEVDLDFTKEVNMWIRDNGDTSGFFNVQELAKYFFELGMAASNKA